MHVLRRFGYAVALALFAFFAGLETASAQTAYGPRIVHLSVVDRETGEAKRVYLHDRRYFIAAQTGSRYSLRVENFSSERVLVVLSVDGVNVLSGETADFNQRGYILSPHESADINGWRKSQTEIAAFRFAPLAQSYAARTGRPSDVGVIGMAVFRERRPPPPPKISSSNGRRYSGVSLPDMMAPPPPPPPPPPSPGRAEPMPASLNADAAKAAGDASPARAEKVGTAHGEIERDVIRTEPFERASNIPASVRVLEYDSVRNLVAAGVIPATAEEAHQPHAFPGHHDNEGYVPDPPPYRKN